MILRFALLLLLCSASLPLMAREVRQAGANGDGSCPTALDAERHAADAVAADPQAAPAAAVKDKGAATGSGNTENGVRGPRWHSFLPGMFR